MLGKPIGGSKIRYFLQNVKPWKNLICDLNDIKRSPGQIPKNKVHGLDGEANKTLTIKTAEI